MASPFTVVNLTPEQEILIKIESIFMPEARKQRNRLYANKYDPRFVHYTKADAALSIIDNKRLWLRNTTSMTDFREVNHGFTLLQGFFRVKANENAFLKAYDACKPGEAAKAINLFNKWWTHTERGLQTRTYIASISEHHPSEDQHGRLSMWRAFGTSTSARVALVFNVPPASGAMQFLNCLFSPVAYLTEKQVFKVVRTIINNIRRERDFLKSLPDGELFKWIFEMLVAGVTCIKHEGFKEEREWRIIYFPGMRPSPHIDEKIKIINGVPQVIYELPIDKKIAPQLEDVDIASMFHSLILGPASQPWIMYEAFTRALKNAGVPPNYADGHVLTSGIPLRSF